jgi:hypothetical protein
MKIRSLQKENEKLQIGDYYEIEVITDETMRAEFEGVLIHNCINLEFGLSCRALCKEIIRKVFRRG